jgi:transcriptional regulator with XRE-family HTH domain
MASEQFRAWRHSLSLSQPEAAEALGLSRETVSNYERGSREGGRPVSIPKSVELACAALAIGVRGYNGPEGSNRRYAVPVEQHLIQGTLSNEVVEWCLENLRGPMVVQNGIAVFASERDAFEFKMRWG